MQFKGLEDYELRRCPTYCWYKEGSLFEDDDVVDPHLERIKNEAGGDESDEEVIKHILYNFHPYLLVHK